MTEQYLNTFNPSSPQRSVNEATLKEMIDINDDGKINHVDIAIIVGIGLLGYMVCTFAFKMLKRG